MNHDDYLCVYHVNKNGIRRGQTNCLEILNP